ncbi:hypothetical protein FTX61_08425 [Nitriliruptoraceae bacterium ZYF776]|nr:hypothetical protein [Profundirhabdus halotolerans]
MTLPRSLVALAVLVLLGRAGRVAWHHRALSVALWRAIGWREATGALALFAVVAGTATLLLAEVPVLSLGLGELVGTSGNAVFVPLEAGLAYAPLPATGPDWPLLVGATVFLGLLLLLLPWLAYVEEELFRAGYEAAPWPRIVLASLLFGLVHLVVLVPLGAALAIGLAGFVYAVVYRRAATAPETAVPAVAVAAYRPTRRARAAAGAPRAAQAAGVFRAAVWHTAFNTTVVLAVWLTIVVDAWV